MSPVLPLVLDLLVVDETNPRSIGYQVTALSTLIDTLPQTGKGQERTEVQRMALAMLSDVRIADVVRLAKTNADGIRPELVALLGAIAGQIPPLTDALTRRYFSMIEKEPRWVRARSRQPI